MANIKRGTKIRVKKGTTLRSTHPQKDGPFEAGRTYTVTVDHVMETGWRECVGEIIDGRYCVNGHWRRLSALCTQYGIKHNPPYDDENYAKLGQLSNVVIEDGPYPKIKQVWLIIRPPSVVWAGSGRYWVEAPLDQVEIVEEAA